MKILVVEDLSTLQQVTMDTLRQLGFSDCRQTGDPNTALSDLACADYGLLLVDWDMPGLYGIELLRAIRGSSSLCSIPVLMVTNDAGRDKLTEAAGSGVNGYLVRPFSAQQLMEKIKSICEEIRADVV